MTDPRLVITAEFEPVATSPSEQAEWRCLFGENSIELGNLGGEEIILDFGCRTGAFSALCLRRGAKYVYSFELDVASAACAARNLETVWRRFSSEPSAQSFCVSHLKLDDGAEVSATLQAIFGEFSRVDILRICDESAFEHALKTSVIEKVKMLYLVFCGHSTHFVDERTAAYQEHFQSVGFSLWRRWQIGETFFALFKNIHV